MNLDYSSYMNNFTENEIIAFTLQVENLLFDALKDKVTDVVAVKVMSFTAGSIIADIRVVIHPLVEKDAVNSTIVETSLVQAINDGLLTALNVDQQYKINVTG